MQPNQILTADWLDILFDGKNKEYGAYQLRKAYNNRMNMAMLITLLIVVTPILIYVLSNKKEVILPPVIISDPIDIAPPPIIEQKIDPPAASSKQPKRIQTVKSTTILVVPDNNFKEADQPPIQPDLDNVKIGLINQQGYPDEGMPSPDAAKGGAGNGLTNANSVGQGSGTNPDVFIPIELESEYPGGQKAWSRFLNRTLGNNYPPEAFEKGIQGTVVIQFVVDVDGSVSNIEALSGPEELREAAINTIRKSGKWKPAIQNGKNVKTYKRQPITFVLQGE